MRFKTASGAEYELLDIQEDTNVFTARFRRTGPLALDARTGEKMEVPTEAVKVTFLNKPYPGSRFQYWMDGNDGFLSSTVVEVDHD
jgi:hypothetical protein